MFAQRIDDEIKLRIFDERHAAESFALVDSNREYLREYMPWVDDTRFDEDTRAFIRRSRADMANENGFAAGIWYRGNLAGTIGVNSINRFNRKAEIGYWLGEEFQGKGIMTRCCRAVVTYLFDDQQLEKVEIHAAETNARSRAIPQRLGFVEEGTLRMLAYHDGKREGLVVYGMLADEWRALQSRG